MSVNRDLLHIDGALDARMDTAMDLFQAGTAVVYCGLRLQLTSDHIQVDVPSRWAGDQVTMASATSDFAAASASLDTLGEASAAFARAATSRPILLTLIHDYGNGSVAICKKTTSGIQWMSGIRHD